MSNSYLLLQLDLLKHVRSILQAMADQEVVPEGNHEAFLERFDDVYNAVEQGSDDLYLGQEVMCQIFMRYPQIAPMIPRDLLWFFGGDCLHYMPDHEIALFQQLEEQRYEAMQENKPFDWAMESQRLFMPTERATH
ncbi:PA2817 family protein [Pseudomonas sp. F1_0610]|uniref:PA2817 family protein n=1 Tax=Pseudomonas sp. F1_0610 TaxID=3114284 RepID=UPI0039C19980